MSRSDPYRWQAPGNGRLFDSSLEMWESNKMSQRCIGVLQFLDENPSIHKDDFEVKIAKYLEDRYGHEPNDSNKAHFYRPLEFIGFMRNIGNSLSLSIDGKNFLNSMLCDDFDSALEFYVLQLLKTSYPNHATEDNRLSLFPFRVMFKLMSENEPHNGIVPKKMFYTDIPYIRTYDDVNLLLNKLSDKLYIRTLEQYTLKDLKQMSDQYYEKWYIWIIASLREMNILQENGKRNNIYVKLANPIDGFIQGIVDKMKYKDMFFSSGIQFENVKNNIRCKPRDRSIIQEVLNESHCTCFFSDIHESFRNFNSYDHVEAHHIIPVDLNDSFDEELDCKENIIALCPNCHKAIHYAKNECKGELLQTILDNNENFSKFNLTLDDLKEFYFNKEVPMRI